MSCWVFPFSVSTWTPMNWWTSSSFSLQVRLWKWGSFVRLNTMDHPPTYCMVEWCWSFYLTFARSGGGPGVDQGWIRGGSGVGPLVLSRWNYPVTNFNNSHWNSSPQCREENSFFTFMHPPPNTNKSRIPDPSLNVSRGATTVSDDLMVIPSPWSHEVDPLFKKHI